MPKLNYARFLRDAVPWTLERTTYAGCRGEESHQLGLHSSRIFQGKPPLWTTGARMMTGLTTGGSCACTAAALAQRYSVTSLSKISTRWPMLHTALGIVLTFSLFVPVLWLFSSLLIAG